MSQEPVNIEEIPAYILHACEAAAEWWARSDQDPRIKFQPQVILKLLIEIREGAHYEPACAVAGVTYTQFRNWMNRAEDEGPESPHGIVACAVKVAEAEAENESVRYVRAASRDPRFWAAGMTFLERRHPDRWRRPDAAPSVQVNVGIAIGLQATEEQRRALVPRVVIEQIAPESAEVVQAGHLALSPAAESAITLSPARAMAVTDANSEAKATPNKGVSPPSVA